MTDRRVVWACKDITKPAVCVLKYLSGNINRIQVVFPESLQLNESECCPSSSSTPLISSLISPLLSVASLLKSSSPFPPSSLIRFPHISPRLYRRLYRRPHRSSLFLHSFHQGSLLMTE